MGGTCIVLGCMPTGSGKTVIASEVIKRKGGRALVLCHTPANSFLNLQEALAFWVDSEIEKADLWADTNTFDGAPVVTLHPRLSTRKR